MIKITNAHAHREETTGEVWITVDIEIDGKKTSVGRIPTNWNRQEVKAYLNSKRDEILANINIQEEDILLDRQDLVER